MYPYLYGNATMVGSRANSANRAPQWLFIYLLFSLIWWLIIFGGRVRGVHHCVFFQMA